MSGIQLDYSDITEIFKEKLKIDNIVKNLASVFQNDRYFTKIDYKPYFQRNYVWDDEKASYFIESILLGTEIPPIVLFQTKDKNEVIDGRQRFETITRFLKDRLILQEKGLHSLKSLSGKKYSQIEPAIQEAFEETRIRIIQFSVVDEPHLSNEQKDKIKKEIFRRYNSGITPLQKYDIDRAAYINDPISNHLYKTIFLDEDLLSFLSAILLPPSKRKVSKRDKVNILVSLSRTLITMSYVPIFSYSHGSSKSEILGKYYERYIKTDVEETIEQTTHTFIQIIHKLKYAYENLPEIKLKNNNLFYETLYWAISVANIEGRSLDNVDIDNCLKLIMTASDNQALWNGINNLPQNNVDTLYEATGSHYYSAINNRYQFICNVFYVAFNIDISKHLKNKDQFNEVMSDDIELKELKRYQLNKPLPETLSIEDILADMQKNRFLIRPDYQRSEVTNTAKASYLMESIMLGIKIPPIFVYKREDKVKEVVDGQQRLLTIIGFLGRTYLDEKQERINSDKDRFKLKQLKILSELNGKNIDTIDEKFEDRILDFPIDVIEISSDQNPNFSPIDLFLRLNTKPYPIKENTFEMWNAYCDKNIIIKIRELANKYETKIYRSKDPRMKLEELLTSLSYLDYKIHYEKERIDSVLNIYKRYSRINARIKDKSNVTKTLSNISMIGTDQFLQSVDNVELFSEKVNILIGDGKKSVKQLFNHKRKTSSFKTDQNFYFLWIMLSRIDAECVRDRQEQIFNDISTLFGIIQNTPDEYGTEQFLTDVKSFWKNYGIETVLTNE